MIRRSKGLTPSVKTLTESEIQDRLYGDCLGRRRPNRPAASQKVFSADPEPASEAQRPAAAPKGWPLVQQQEAGQWTGAEILATELKRLRDDLIALRQERERLAAELERRRTGKRDWKIPGRIAAVGALIVSLAMPVGLRLLQASPAGMEFSPYTVQVAVYDVKQSADRALAWLQQSGYPAFLVEASRRNGKPRYRLYVGSHVTREEAQMELQRLTSDPRFADAFIRIR